MIRSMMLHMGRHAIFDAFWSKDAKIRDEPMNVEPRSMRFGQLDQYSTPASYSWMPLQPAGSCALVPRSDFE